MTKLNELNITKSLEDILNNENKKLWIEDKLTHISKDNIINYNYSDLDYKHLSEVLSKDYTILNKAEIDALITDLYNYFK